MNKLVLLATILWSTSAFATNVVSNELTSTHTSANSSSVASVSVRPGTGTAIAETGDIQHSLATASADADHSHLSVSNSIDGSAHTAGEAFSRSVTTGTGRAAAASGGTSDASSSALASGALCGCHPVNGIVAGEANSHNANGAASGSVGNGSVRVYEGSYNDTYYQGTANASGANGDHASTSATTESYNGVSGAYIIRSGHGNGLLTNFTNNGSATVVSQSQAGNVNSGN